jgi:hypothetical protein
MPYRMATLRVALSIACWLPVMGHAAEPVLAKPELSVRDQIKAARAKYDNAEKNAPQARSWDRDANGKRPWDRNEPPK